jgi:fructose-1,6-bisphosphatase/inositol monophosphatase family enzyme
VTREPDDLIVSLVEFYLPLLVTAGNYARRIQSSLERPQQKNGANAWTRALTDADLMVQNFIEISTLSHQPGIGFFGEESAQSVNTKYFPAAAETVVHLDPINGTYLYENQRSGWDIVLSIRHANRLVAALSYMPVRGRFYIAIEGLGALTGDQRTLRIEDMDPLSTQTGSNRCLLYQAPEVRERLSGSLECFDIVEDDDPTRDVDNLNDLFTGKLDAFACCQGDLLDWGATAFIAAHAGGCASYLNGSEFSAFTAFDPEEKADMLVTTNPGLHKRILDLL